jgi:hypothetical protein
VRLKLDQHDDRDRDDDRRRDPVLEQSDRYAQSAGYGQTDQRHERAEEDQHAEGSRERHAQNEQDDHHRDAVEQRDQHLPTHVAAERAPAGPTGDVNPSVSSLREQSHDPFPDLVAVAQQEERRQQDQQQRAEGLDDRAHRLDGTAHQLALMLLDRLRDVVGGLVEVRRLQVQRAVAQPVASLVDEVGDLVGHLGRVRADLPGHEPADSGEHGESDEQSEQRRYRPRAGDAAQLHFQRMQHRGEEQREHERERDELDPVEGLEEDPQRGADHEQAPAPRRRDPYRPRNRFDRTVGIGVRPRLRARIWIAHTRPRFARWRSLMPASPPRAGW